MFHEFYQICKNTFIFHNLSQTRKLTKVNFSKIYNSDLDNYDDLTIHYYNILESILRNVFQNCWMEMKIV